MNVRQAQGERGEQLGAAEELQGQDAESLDLGAQVRTLAWMALIILLTGAAMLVEIGIGIGLWAARWGGPCA